MNASTIYRNRGRLMKNRAGTWTLAFNVDYPARPGHGRRSGYVQMRGKRADLIEHAKTIGITDLYLPGVLGLVMIDIAGLRLDSLETNEAKYAHLNDRELEAQWWNTADYVSEACETEHFEIEGELDRRNYIKQESAT